jgi:Zn-dependent M16 (insulinase) family peptidase
LSSLLIGNPASPLYQALINSGLGSNIVPGSGYQDENRSTYFAAGLQGVDTDQTDAVEKLILDTLKQTAETGFSPERIEGVIHRLEFSHREVSGDRYPYSLGLLMRMIGPWLHADDPLTPLNIEKNLEQLRKELQKGSFFENCIHRFLLNNQHRVTLTLYPDETLEQKEKDQTANHLKRIAEELTAVEKKAIIDESASLKKSQETLEDITCLPTLALADIPKEEKKTAHRQTSLSGRPVFHFPQPTNGIGYFTAHFPTTTIPSDLMRLVPLYCSVITQMGAAGYSYIEMSERMESETGGLHFFTEIHDNPNTTDRFIAVVGVRGKALVRKQDQLFKILTDYCTAADFSDTKRLRTVLKQILTSFENSIPGSGHLYAVRAGAAKLSPSACLREQWSGLTLLNLVRDISEMDDSDLVTVADKLKQISHILANKNQITCALTTSGEEFREIDPELSSFISSFPEQETHEKGQFPVCQRGHGTLGWAASVPVAFVTRCFKTIPYTHADSAPLQVLSKIIKDGYLHREIREKGGAYGGLVSYDNEAGIFSFLSYRDPHIKRTLLVYSDAVDWAVAGEFTDEAIHEALLSVFSSLDKPLSPGSRGNHEFSNLQQGLTLEMRQQYRRNLLATTRVDLQRVAKAYLQDNRLAPVDSILASEEKILAELGKDGVTVIRV